MQFTPELLPAVLRGRRKRFFADITLSDGSEAIAHCPNPGSMKGNCTAGMKVFVEDTGADHLARGRKLRYRWVLADRGSHVVCVDTSLANRIVANALAAGAIPELAGFEEIIPEFSVGESRLDFLLRSKNKSCFVEVKSVSMIEDGISYFPDSVTTRGQKHLQELMELKLAGHRAVILFVVQAAGVKKFRPADQIDPKYGLLLREAVKNGVEALVYGISAEATGIRWDRPCELEL